MRASTIVPSLLVLLTISIVPAIGDTQIASDPRLSKPAALECDSRPLRDIIADYSKDLGLSLSAEPIIADTPITGKLSSRPAHQVLQSLADLVLGEWRQEGGKYVLTLSQPGRDKEAQILRERSWSIAERREKIVKGLQVPPETWLKACDVSPNPIVRMVATPKQTKPQVPDGFSYPEDYSLITALASPFRRAVLDLAVSLPEPIWEDMREGVEMPISSLPRDKRKALADILNGPAPSIPGLIDAKEKWPAQGQKPAVVESLLSGDGELRFQLKTDRLGRWNELLWSIKAKGADLIFSSISIGTYFLQEHTMMTGMILTKPGTQFLYQYERVLPDGEAYKKLEADPWLLGEIENVNWPPAEESGFGGGARDSVIYWMGSTLGVDYLATRFDNSPLRSSTSGKMTRGRLIDAVAGSLESNWELCGGVYLFREKDWPLKRNVFIPVAYFDKYTAKLSPEKHLSLDDIAAAYAELTPQQRQHWQDNQSSLPLQPYAHTILGDGKIISAVWLQLSPEQKERMKITYTSGPESNPFANNAGISMAELPPSLQQYVLNSMSRYTKSFGAEVKPENVRLGWMHYSVSDGFQRDRLSFRISSDVRSVESCLFEIFHPKAEDWQE